MVNKKITELTELTTPVSADVVAIIDDTVGTPVTKKITYGNIQSNLTLTASQISDFDTEVGNNSSVTTISGAGVTVSGALVSDIANLVTVSGAGVAVSGALVTDTANLVTVSGAGVTVSGAAVSNTTHRNDNTQAHSDYLKNDAVDVGVGISLTGDNSSADTTYVPNVLYNTDATPPTASTVPIGTIYVQYTA